MGRSPVYEKGNAWIRVCEVIMYPLSALLARRRFVNLDAMTRSGPMIIVANHVSHVDPIFDAVFIRKSGRIPHIMAKASLWKVPVVGKALVGTRQIPVERGAAGAGQSSLDEATKVLEAGGVVLIYAEGSVTKEPDFWPMRPKPGVAALALAGDFPVIPVAHWGTQDVYNSYAPKSKFHPLPRKDVHVVAGDPIDLSAWRGKPADARAIRDVSLLIMGTIRNMVAELRHEEPPTEFFDPKKAARLAANGPPSRPRHTAAGRRPRQAGPAAPASSNPEPTRRPSPRPAGRTPARTAVDGGDGASAAICRPRRGILGHHLRQGARRRRSRRGAVGPARLGGRRDQRRPSESAATCPASSCRRRCGRPRTSTRRCAERMRSRSGCPASRSGRTSPSSGTRCRPEGRWCPWPRASRWAPDCG